MGQLSDLTDDQILLLCDMQMPDDQQRVLSELLARNRENQLGGKDIERLDELMQIYKNGMIRKAEALQVAVERGLRSPLS